MKLYTKTGDKGTTGLIGGTRVSKSDVRLEAYGTVDELNAQIGVLVSLGVADEHAVFLRHMQNLLFTVGSNLATDTDKTDYKVASVMKDEYIADVEKEIDRLDKALEPLRSFIIPEARISRLSATYAGLLHGGRSGELLLHRNLILLIARWLCM